jgi:hypothetical protein
MEQIQFVHALKRANITSTLIVATTTEWANIPEATSPLWQAVVVGDLVYALALDSRALDPVTTTSGAKLSGGAGSN